MKKAKKTVEKETSCGHRHDKRTFQELFRVITPEDPRVVHVYKKMMKLIVDLEDKIDGTEEEKIVIITVGVKAVRMSIDDANMKIGIPPASIDSVLSVLSDLFNKLPPVEVDEQVHMEEGKGNC